MTLQDFKGEWAGASGQPQFLPSSWVKYAVDIFNKSVYICGLDSDFERNKFGLLLDLIPYCDKVKKLKAICVNCKINYAIFTHRLGNEKKQKIIGGTSSYISLCRKCFLQINN